VTREILTTEQAYVDSLAICVDVYYRPLVQANVENRSIVSPDKLATLFKGLDVILAANRKLLASLEMRLGKD
jgi:hypothetical protein